MNIIATYCEHRFLFCVPHEQKKQRPASVGSAGRASNQTVNRGNSYG